MKLVIVIGTRPEIIRLSQIIKKAKHFFDVILIHTGQNYDYNLNEIFFEDLEIPPPDIYLNCSRDNIGSTIGDIISKTYEIFEKIEELIKAKDATDDPSDSESGPWWWRRTRFPSDNEIADMMGDALDNGDLIMVEEVGGQRDPHNGALVPTHTP